MFLIPVGLMLPVPPTQQPDKSVTITNINCFSIHYPQSIAVSSILLYSILYCFLFSRPSIAISSFILGLFTNHVTLGGFLQSDTIFHNRARGSRDIFMQTKILHISIPKFIRNCFVAGFNLNIPLI